MKFTFSRQCMAAGLLPLALLAGCGGSDPVPVAAPVPETPAYTLQLLHFSDADGSDTTALNSVASLSGLITQFRAAYPSNTLLVSSGDNYIPGPRFNASYDPSLKTLLGTENVGRADIALLNAMGVQASAIGNHELDLGTREFAGMISASGAWTGAQFPYLSYNVDFSTDSNTKPLAVANGGTSSGQNGKVTGWSRISVGGETIGLIGAGSPVFKNITSTDGLTFTPAMTSSNVDIDGLAAEIQKGVDEITAAGINKIVLLAHMQTLDTEKALASKLRNVDIIVAGGSNTLLADSNDVLRTGAVAAGDYPYQTNSASGQPVVVVNVDSDYKYLGRFIAPFNKEGVLMTAKFDNSLSGAWVTNEASSAQAVAKVVEIRDSLKNVLAIKDGAVFGSTSVFLEGRRAAVRNQETNFGNLTADANLWYAKLHDSTVQITLKNGGGIRSEIGEVLAIPGSTSGATLSPPKANPEVNRAAGQVSQLAIETALKFNNKLWVLDVTATQLKQLLEHGVANLGSQGRFPQVGGMAFSYDATQAAQVLNADFAVTTPGQRIRSLKVGADTVVQNGAIVGNANRSFRLVTLNFLAGRGDGFPFPLKADMVNLIELDSAMTSSTAGGVASTSTATLGSEQDALMKYLKTQFTATPFGLADTPEADDTRIQNLARRTDSVLN
ncbi:MAG: bifunctional metallophosphatase/5'-nucleotidase [Hydrogenophaga sp.]|uniref:bifunctional metallophosphatase/5'-nucleotidase n=1 Tax=Hydrogenophaga sp. TaxID=1904254 RepID=UPI002ABA25E8|nr:bifunctional metallophosphatase/5'-nucleotidase [Hydrogenophaga sp.]MDZ4187346.1 bifunctional metallophosphatase/5'-nucleotidase [Hydrogenophaga sp.]